MGEISPTKFKAIKPKNIVKIFVDDSSKKIRKYVIGAVIRNVHFDQAAFNSFIDLQEKLHHNICRQRTLVSIGTHNLDSVSPPFYYKAVDADKLSLIALKETKKMTVKDLFENYRNRSVCSIKKYLDILEPFNKILAITDSQNNILSLPPIINSELSKVSPDVRNIFIDITATDLTKAEIVLNVLCSFCAAYSHNNKENSIEKVEVVSIENNRSLFYPNMDERKMPVSLAYLKQGLGHEIKGEEVVNLLRKMQIDSFINESDNQHLEVTIPASRSDVLHPCDILEDVAIAFGYDNIKRTIPNSYTVAEQQPLNKISEKVRVCLSQCGFVEVLNWILSSKADNFKNMREEERNFVDIANPKTKELEICRTSLLPGLLKCLAHSLGRTTLPLCLFEVGDIVMCCDDQKGAANRRKACAVYMGRSSESFEKVHSVLDRLMTLFDIKFGDQEEIRYFLEESNHKRLFPGRQADVFIEEKGQEKFCIGNLGILHPDVSENFSESINSNGLLISVVEIDVERMLDKKVV